MIQTATTMDSQIVITPEMKEADTINQILRGEISAVEAYKQALSTIDSKPEKQRLQVFLESHQKNVDYWRAQATLTVGEPDTSSGLWGYVVEAFVGGAKLFGNTATLGALKRGEEHGISEYREFLKNNFVSQRDKKHVVDNILPDLESHIISIDAMMELQ